LIWAEGDDFTGWCCSHCPWGITAPRLESTVAALAFNRLAQESFEKHQYPQGIPMLGLVYLAWLYLRKLNLHFSGKYDAS